MMRMATAETLRSFNSWLGEQPHRHKVLTCGNHEFEFERDPLLRDQITNGQLLVNSGIELEGLRIWGSPVTPLAGGAFGIEEAKERERHWARVPQGTHLLLVHGPPFGVLDGSSGRHCGDPELLTAIRRTPSIRLVVFGRTHGCRGITEVDGVIYVNASLLGADGGIEYEPISIRMDRQEKLTYRKGVR